MDNNDATTKNAEALRHLKLSQTARNRITENLGNYADFHAARIATVSRSIEEVSPTTLWCTSFFTRLHLNSMPLFAIAAMLLIGGGTTFAAQNSLPGELLYPVKVGVNEHIRLAFAVSNEAETEVQLALLEERVREAQALEAQGRLDGELAVAVRTNVRTQASAANRASDESDATVAVAVNSGITAALARFNTLTGHDDRLTIATLVDAGARFASRDDMPAGTSGSARAETSLSLDAPIMAKTEADMGVSTMLAVGPAPMSVLYQNAQIHLDAVQAVIQRYTSEIQAEQYVEFKATLDEAAQLMSNSRAQTNQDMARPMVEEATEIIGSVEAALTLLGEATIDMETGAILDIDFSRKPADRPGMIDIFPMPPVMMDYGDGQTGAGGGADSVINIENDMIDTTVSTDVESNLSF